MEMLYHLEMCITGNENNLFLEHRVNKYDRMKLVVVTIDKRFKE